MEESTSDNESRLVVIKTGDYHTSMNFANFSKWLLEMFLPNLPSNSVVLLDNAAYHNVEANKKPNCGSLKKDVIDWLRNNNIDADETMTKAQLLLQVRAAPVGKTFKIDEWDLSDEEL